MGREAWAGETEAGSFAARGGGGAVCRAQGAAESPRCPFTGLSPSLSAALLASPPIPANPRLPGQAGGGRGGMEGWGTEAPQLPLPGAGGKRGSPSSLFIINFHLRWLRSKSNIANFKHC